MFLGENLFPLLVLAVGGGLAVGTITAFVRPKQDVGKGELSRPPLLRSIIQVVLGLGVSIWALATLLA